MVNVKRSPLKRRTGLKRGGRINPIGRKARREREALEFFRDEVCRRDNGVCRAAMLRGPRNALLVCGRRGLHAGTEAHHMWPEDRDRGIHDPERGLWLCTHAHRWAHEHPAEAAVLGLLRPAVS
jgi:hypothetical protein